MTKKTWALVNAPHLPICLNFVNFAKHTRTRPQCQCLVPCSTNRFAGLRAAGGRRSFFDFGDDDEDDAPAIAVAGESVAKIEKALKHLLSAQAAQRIVQGQGSAGFGGRDLYGQEWNNSIATVGTESALYSYMMNVFAPLARYVQPATSLPPSPSKLRTIHVDADLLEGLWPLP